MTNYKQEHDLLKKEDLLGLMKELEPAFRTIVRGLGLKYENYDNLFQDTFLKIYRQLSDPAHNVKGISIHQYTKTVFANVCRDYLRKRKRKERFVEDYLKDETIINSVVSKETTPLETAIKKEQRQLVQRAISNLSTKNQEILYMLYFEGISSHDTAKALNINYNTVKSRTFRAKEKLEKKLEQMCVN